MKDGALVLLAVAIAGVIWRNDLVAIAAGGTFLISAAASPGALSLLERYAIPTGVIFLTAGLLFPFASGQLGFAAVAQTLVSPSGFVAIAVGAASSYLAADGVKLIVAHPEVLVGLVIGTLVGVSAFGGIPVGPLVAAGLVALAFHVLRL